MNIFVQAVWRRIEETGFVTDSSYQIPYRPSSQLRLIHLTRMVNVTAAQQTSYNQHNDPDHARTHTVIREFVDAPSCSKRSYVDSRRDRHSALHPVSRSWTLALSHPVCVAFDAYGGSGADSGSRTRRHSDRTTEPIVTSPLHPRAHYHDAAQRDQSRQ